MKNQPINSLIKDNLLILGISLLLIVATIVEPRFLTVRNFQNIIRQFGPLIMVALGMTFVILGGFIDLSVGGIVSLVAVVTLSLIDPIGQVWAISVGILLGLVCGLITSFFIITSGGLSLAESLFITYGMSLVYSALALIYTGAQTRHISYSETSVYIFDAINHGQIGPFSVSFLMFLICLFILYIIENRTHIGRSILLTGGNKIAARLAGIPVERSVVVMYAVSGIMAAIGAVVLMSRVGIASPVMGENFATWAILAVVVGGTALLGGRGGVIRTVIGTLLIILMNNSLNLMGVSTYFQFMSRGAILIVAIWLDNRRQISMGN